jgi:hypothetical protein
MLDGYEVNSHILIEEFLLRNEYIYFFPQGLHTPAQMIAAVQADQAAGGIPAVVPGVAAMGAMGGAGAGAGAGGAGFMHAEQLLEGAEHIDVMKPGGVNSINLTEFKVGDPVILIYEGGEASVPQIFKRAALLAHFNHTLAQPGPQIIKNPLTNTPIISKGQPLPDPDAHSRRIFDNGVIIKTGNIIVREQYQLRSKGPVKPRRSRNRKSRRTRRNATRHRKNRRNMY